MKIGSRIGAVIGPDIGNTMGSGSASPPGSTTLTVAISDSADPVITEVNFDYLTVVTNTGGEDATLVVCTITLDPQLTHVSTSGTGWTVDTTALPIITCTRALLAPGAAPTITTTVTSPAAAETSSTTADADASNSSPAAQDTETTVVNLVTRDATSGKRFPNSSTEWTNFLAYNGLAAAVPNSMWLCQEAAGNLTDSIGTLTLTANAAPAYQQAATGHSRLGVQLAEVANQRFTAAAAAGPNPTTTSSLWLWFGEFTAAPSGTRVVLSVSDGAVNFRANILVTPRIRLSINAVNSDGVSDPVAGADVMPMAIKYDRTNSEAKVFTGQEKITGTYSAAVVDGLKGLGTGGAAAVRFVYGVMWSGAAGEMSDANLKALLEALGYTIPWS